MYFLVFQLLRSCRISIVSRTIILHLTTQWRDARASDAGELRLSLTKEGTRNCLGSNFDLSQTPGRIPKMDLPQGSAIYTKGIIESRIEGSMLWILPGLLVEASCDPNHLYFRVVCSP